MVSRKNVRLEFPTSTVGYKPYMASLYSMASPLFDFKGHTTITKRILLDSDFFLWRQTGLSDLVGLLQ